MSDTVSTTTATGKTPAWLVVWTCQCSEVQTDAAALPEQCPGHGTSRIASPELLDVLNEFVGLHECGDVLGHGLACPAVTR